ncbi:RNA polymerase ECF-type sigma factor [Filimonas lacunae]|nr:RNA polymerase ECF-type sigma factor [Filimonas lacunae]
MYLYSVLIVKLTVNTFANGWQTVIYYKPDHSLYGLHYVLENQERSRVIMKYKESELAKEIAVGNHAAFDQLYRLLYPALYLVAFRLSKSETVAADIVSDVFLRVWDGRDRLPEIKDLNAYLYISTKNTTFNYLKRQNGIDAVTSGMYTDNRELSDDSFFENLFYAETIRQLKEAVQALPPECRKVTELVLEGQSTNDIAKKLNISPSAVSHQKGRAAKLLKGKILLLLLIFYASQ